MNAYKFTVNGQMGIPLLMKVAKMYNTIEISTFPAVILIWAN